MSKLDDLVFWNLYGNSGSTSGIQSQYAKTSQLINYISEWKKIIVGRNNQAVTQKFKIDNRISDTYFFQIVNRNNQIVEISDNYDYQFFGSFIDAKNEMHVVFYSDTYNISESNVIAFKVNTFTSEYLYNIKRPKEIDITIKKKSNEQANGLEKVILRDSGIAYPCPAQPDQEPTPVVAGEGLSLNGYVMSLQNPLSTSFGAGSGITFIQPSPSLFTFAFGKELMAGGDQFVIGKYNEIDYNAPFIIGWGNSDERNNIFTVDSLGNVSGTAFYANGVQVATINEVSGITYTAGEGIGISDQNVISLTATIPDAVSSFPDSSYYIKSILSRTSISAVSYDANRWIVGIDYNSLHNAGFAYTSAIPTSTSQLTNDSGFITNSALSDYATKTELETVSGAIPTSYVTSSDLNNYATTGMLDAVSSAIPLSTSQLTNDSGFITSSYLTGYASTEDIPTKTSDLINDTLNNSKIYIDTTTHSATGYVLPYNKNYNIFMTRHYADSNGLIHINPLTANIENGTAITFEHWIGCYEDETTFSGFAIDQNIDVIGDLPSAFLSGENYVFTRRLIKINNGTVEQISFAYMH